MKNISSILTFIILFVSCASEKKQDQKIKSVKRVNSSKYTGTHNGRWEGFLLNQLNSGNAKFEVKSNGNATLSMTGKFNATHTGKVKGDKFITDKNQTCSIVDLGGGNFKVVLIWTGVNVDVMF